MGITIDSKNRSIDLGYDGFNRLRTKVAELANEDIFNHYKKLDDAPIIGAEARKIFFEEYDKKTIELDERYEGKMHELLNFLYACDCEAEISLDICKKIYEVIKDYDDDLLYGYYGRPDCAMFKDFKELVKDCIDNKCAMEWC